MVFYFHHANLHWHQFIPADVSPPFALHTSFLFSDHNHSIGYDVIIYWSFDLHFLAQYRLLAPFLYILWPPSSEVYLFSFFFFF